MLAMKRPVFKSANLQHLSLLGENSRAASRPIRVVLDTDTYNEVDDQFALAHLFLSPDRICLEAVYAAPFYYPQINRRSKSAADGMERSYAEIHRLFELLGARNACSVFRGSRRFMASANRPVESPAARDLIKRARRMPRGEKLFVGAIAAATNVASALLLAPDIVDKIVIVWLGGHAPYWPNTREFNLIQDTHAATVLLTSAAPLVWIPCLPVASHLQTTKHELRVLLAPHSRLGHYLTDIVADYGHGRLAHSKPIWDMAVSAWLINPNWVICSGQRVPNLTQQTCWDGANLGKSAKVATHIKRDDIFRDFFRKAKNADKRG